MSAPILKSGDTIHIAFPYHDEEVDNEINERLLEYYGNFGIHLGAVSFLKGMNKMMIVSVIRNE